MELIILKKYLKFVLTLTIISFATSYAVCQSKKAQKFIESYQLIAHLNFDNNLLNIRKWEEVDTIKYKIQGELKYMNRKNLRKYLNKIEELIDIKFTESTSENQAQINIFFGDLNEYFILINRVELIGKKINFDNWSTRSPNNEMQLTKAGFCVDPKKVKSKRRGRWLIKNGILKSLGFLGKSDSEYSIFYKYNTKFNLSLSKFDKRVIKMHYSKIIKSNMTFEEVEYALKNDCDVDSFLKVKI